MSDFAGSIPQNKLPPYNLEAEQSVLSACLKSSESFARSLETLTAEDFYKSSHQKIYTVLRKLFEENMSIDILTLSEGLRREKIFEEVGGLEYLSFLEDFVPTSSAIAHHAKIVKDKKILRELIQTATEIVSNSYNEFESIDQILDQAEKNIFEISDKRTTRNFVRVSDVVKTNIRDAEKLSEEPGMVTGIPTGFLDLDHMTSGLQPSDLIILAGRPSMGKTSFALDIARHAAIHAQAPSVVFSLEMSKEQLVNRMLCAEARVDSNKLRTGYIAKSDWPKLHQAGARLSQAPIFIDDSGSLSGLEIRARTRRLAAEQNLGLIIVDYLQLMHSASGKESRQLEISEISRGLKSLAKELNIPVIALSQLSRAVESRTDKRPLLSDLRESGAIEQDADVVMFIYRDEVYNPETQDVGIAEVLIRKQRNGPIGDVRLGFENQFTRFHNVSSREDAPNPDDAPPIPDDFEVPF